MDRLLQKKGKKNIESPYQTKRIRCLFHFGKIKVFHFFPSASFCFFSTIDCKQSLHYGQLQSCLSLCCLGKLKFCLLFVCSYCREFYSDFIWYFTHFSGGFISGCLLETLSSFPRSDLHGRSQIWQVFGGQSKSPSNVFHCRVKPCSTLQPQDSNPDLISKILALNILKTFSPKQPLPYKWSSTSNTGIKSQSSGPKSSHRDSSGIS